MSASAIRKAIAAMTGACLMCAAGAAPAGASVALPLPPLYQAQEHALASVTGRMLSRFVDGGGVASLAADAVSAVAAAFSRASPDLAAALTQVEPAGRQTASTLSPAGKTAAPVRRGATGKAAFDTVAIPFKKLAALKKLAPALDEMKTGRAIACGQDCSAASRAVSAVVGETADLPLRDKLDRVNAVVNGAISYQTDIETYNVSDNWAPPAQTLLRQQGDCEDFAIVKMAALKAAGVDPKEMALVILFDQKRHFYHAVLSVRAGGRHYILDNMSNAVKADSQLPDYMPLYSIADGKGYLHGTRPDQQRLASAIPLDRVAPGEGAVSD